MTPKLAWNDYQTSKIVAFRVQPKTWIWKQPISEIMSNRNDINSVNFNSNNWRLILSHTKFPQVHSYDQIMEAVSFGIMCLTKDSGKYHMIYKQYRHIKQCMHVETQNYIFQGVSIKVFIIEQSWDPMKCSKISC